MGENAPTKLEEQITKGVIAAARARWVVWIFERRAAGVGYANIAAQLSDQHVLTIQGGAWSGVAIKQIVHNPVYIGKIRYREFARAALAALVHASPRDDGH